MQDVLPIMGGDAACLQFLIEQQVLEVPQHCNHCGTLNRMNEKRLGLYRCGACRRQQSMFTGTFFGGSKLGCSKIMLVVYLFLSGATHQVIGNTVGLGKEAVCSSSRSYCCYYTCTD